MANLVSSGISALGNKAREATSSILMQGKAAALSEMPGVTRGFGFASKMLGGSGSSTISQKQQESIRPALIEQTRTLKEVSRNTAKQANLMLVWDRKEDARAAALQKGQEERTARLEKTFSESISSLKKYLSMAMRGGGGKGGLHGPPPPDVAGPDDPGSFRRSLSRIIAIAGGITALLGGGYLAKEAFLRPERRIASTRTSTRRMGGGDTGVPSNTTESLKVTPSQQVTTGVSASGTTLKQKQKAVEVEDKKLRDSMSKDLKGLQKSMSSVDQNTKITPQNISTRAKIERQTKPVDTRTEEQKILDKAQARFLRDFESTSTRAFQKALTKALDLGKNVTASTASREGYIGGQLGQAIGLRRGTQRAFEKAFGKEYGSMFAPMFSQLGEAYLEVGGRLAGQALFGGQLGNKGANTLTGQIIGNLQKGNKGVAAEQLLYGLTGIAAGPETIFAQRGFKSSQEGVSYMADVLSAGTTAMVRNVTGFEGPAPTVIDPRTGNKVEVNSFSDIFSLGTGIPLSAKDRAKAEQIKEMQAKVTEEPGNVIKHKGVAASAVYVVNQEEMGKDQLEQYTGPFATGADAGFFNAEINKLPGVSAEQSQKKVAEATVETPEAINDLYELQDGYGRDHEARDYSISDKDIETQQEVGSAIAGTVASGNAGIMAGLSTLAQAIFGMGSRGGGTSIGIGFGGGGGGGFGGMMMDLGASIVASKLTSGIKNPYLRAGANIVAFTGLKSIGGTFMRNLGTGGSGGYLQGLRGSFGVTPGGFVDRGLNAIGLGGSSSYVSTAQSLAAAGNVDAAVQAYQAAGYTADQAMSLVGRDISAAAAGGGVAGSVASGQAAGMPATQAQVRAVDNALEAGGGTTVSKHLANLPYYYAAYQALSGDVKGAAITAGSYYAGTAVTASLVASNAIAAGSLAAAGVTFGVSLLVGALLGGLFGGKKRKPAPKIGERAVQIYGNNNPSLKYTIYNDRADQGLLDFADALLNVAFNAIKMMEQAGYKLSETEDIIYISMHVNDQWGTMLRIFTEPYSGYKPGQYESGNLGIPSDTSGKNMGGTASKIVKYITDLYKTKNEASATKAEDVNRALNQKSLYQLVQGTVFELDKMDQNVSAGVFAKDPAISKLLEETVLRERSQSRQTKNVQQQLHDNIPGQYYDERGAFVEPGSTKFRGTLAPEGEWNSGDSETPGYWRGTGNTLMWDPELGKYVQPTLELAERYGLQGTFVKGGQPIYYYDSDGNRVQATTYNRYSGEYEIGRTQDRVKIDISSVVGTTPSGIPIIDIDKSGGLSEADFLATIERFGYEATGITAPVNNVSDNSSTTNNYGIVEPNDPYRNATVSTRLPLAA